MDNSDKNGVRADKILDALGEYIENAPAEELIEDTRAEGRDPDELAYEARVAITKTVQDHLRLQNPTGADVNESPIPGGRVPMFRIGNLVALRSDPDTVVPILEVLPGHGEYRYRVFQNGTKSTYYEGQLQLPVGSRDHQKLLASADLKAHLTGLQIVSVSTANLFSLRSGRVQFVPYQYRPVLKLIRSDQPRLLIADEVGVGKTIEAGLIIKELKVRMELSSVLIICPKALVAERKWLLEMRRFDEHFTALDGRLLRHCLNETKLEGEWPEQYSKAILPFSLFDSELILGRKRDRKRKDEGLLNLDPPPKFDLVIVDEAHHIRNSETFLHQGVRYFCDNADAVLFLSATPLQLGREDLYTLLNVLRPDLIIDSASFAQMAEPNRFINDAIQHCRLAEKGWQEQAVGSLEEAVRTEWGRMFLADSPEVQNTKDRLLVETITDSERVNITRAIEELYTFSTLINRTRRRDIGEFTTRKAETLTVEFTPQQSELHDALLSVIARILAFTHGSQNVKFMMTTIRRQAASCLYGLAPLLEAFLNGKVDALEMIEASDFEDEVDLGFVAQARDEIQAVIEQARHLNPRDPKVEAFLRVVREKDKRVNNKMLVFSTFRQTLRYLAEHLEREGLRYGLIHGDVLEEDRSDLRRRFALPKENEHAIDILLSSEVGCEGLDFQFCDFLVNYDLPWNPMRIEQRIGRIDRYGQKSETVAIINFITPGTVDADIYERCLLRIGVFQHAIGGNEEILGEITRELHDIAENFTLTADERNSRLRQIADNSIRQIREEQELESKQAELFGLNVPQQSWRQEIEDAESYWLSPASIQRCVSCYLSARVGPEGEYLLGDKAQKTLRLNQEGRTLLLDDFKRLPRSSEPPYREWEKWLKGSHPTLPITFEQTTAAENPRTHHVSLFHPLVRQAAANQQLDEPAYSKLLVHAAGVRQGAYQFALYRWRKRGVKVDEELVPIASDPQLERELLRLLPSATDMENEVMPGSAEFEELDAQHYAKWTEAQAEHVAQNRKHVEQRIQSLRTSHRARTNALEEQVRRSTNDKIRIMKMSELARAQADFERRYAELQKSATSGDIHAMPVVFGVISVVNEVAK